MIYDYVTKVKASGCFEERRNGQSKYWLYETVNEQLHRRFYNADGMSDALAFYEKELLGGKLTSFAAAGKLLEFYDKLNIKVHDKE